MVSIEVPENYCYVVLFCGVLPAFLNFYLGGTVMSARKKYDVQYPNLYAVPGYHKNADEFNRVQRGHQNMLETISDFRTCAFVGGLKHPVTVAVCGVLYCVGRYLYMAGYMDNKSDVKTARHKKGGPIQFIANIVVMGCGMSSALTLCGFI
mmetsp:Transcript_17823/g.20312  ORF Transcript_17823/g.20312 Transcript_17823/m.20312 type:complete len:151 (-) Transcript_17823:228-680(-)